MKTYLSALAASIIVLIGHILGDRLDFYVTVPGYDIFMHIAGGIAIGLLFFAFTARNIPDMRREKRLIIGAVFVIGVLWEVFEATYNIAGYQVGTRLYYIDTAKDLVDDIIGGCIAAWLSPKLK